MRSIRNHLLAARCRHDAGKGLQYANRAGIVYIEADPERCAHNLLESTVLATELVPYIGYARAAEVAKLAQISGDLLSAMAALEPEMVEFVTGLTFPGIQMETLTPAT